MTEGREKGAISQWLKEGFYFWNLFLLFVFFPEFTLIAWALQIWEGLSLLFPSRLLYHGKLRVSLLSRTDQDGGRRVGSSWAEIWEVKQDLLSSPNLANGSINWAFHLTVKVMPTFTPKQTQKSQKKQRKKSLPFDIWGNRFFPDFFLSVFGYLCAMEAGDKLRNKY